MAERVGFEPTVPGLAEHTISSRAPSANSGISPHYQTKACLTTENTKITKEFSIQFETYRLGSKFRQDEIPLSKGHGSCSSCALCPSWFFTYFQTGIKEIFRDQDWRRGWDSNPRARLFTGQVDFESTPLRPLRYLSAQVTLKAPPSIAKCGARILPVFRK